MSERPDSPAGLCDACVHQKLIGNTRGSTFSLCLRSRSDKRFPRYPRLPVIECAGYEQRRPDQLLSEPGSPSFQSSSPTWRRIETESE